MPPVTATLGRSTEYAGKNNDRFDSPMVKAMLNKKVRRVIMVFPFKESSINNNTLLLIELELISNKTYKKFELMSNKYLDDWRLVRTTLHIS